MSGSVQGARGVSRSVRTRGREVGSRVSLEHEIALIKVSSLRNHHLLGHRVVELPALVALRVSNEDTLLHMCPKASQAVACPSGSAHRQYSPKLEAWRDLACSHRKIDVESCQAVLK
jgi:hypothetical protein